MGRSQSDLTTTSGKWIHENERLSQSRLPGPQSGCPLPGPASPAGREKSFRVSGRVSGSEESGDWQWRQWRQWRRWRREEEKEEEKGETERRKEGDEEKQEGKEAG